jgi:hypothetical protein
LMVSRIPNHIGFRKPQFVGTYGSHCSCMMTVNFQSHILQSRIMWIQACNQSFIVAKK